MLICQRDCPDACSLIIEGNELRGDPGHPVTRGFACKKAKNFMRYYRERRVLYPHLRVGDGFERISWEEALSMISDRLKYVIENYGPEEVLVYNYSGTTGLINYHYPLRLFNAIKATLVKHTLCDEAGELALELHFGSKYGAFPEDMERAKLLVIWGADLSSTSIHAYRIAADLRSRGEIYVVDPRVTKASMLGKHLRPKPGTDTLLAAGVSWYIINEFGVDSGFIEKYTEGFDHYASLISKYNPDLVERLTSVSKKEIRDLAESYSELKPSVTYIGKGVQKTKYGAEAVRLISLIPALVGVHRGFFYSNSWRDFDTDYLEASHLGSGRKVNMLDVPRLLADGKFKFIYIYNSNPAATLPNAALFRKGMMRKDLFKVVHEVVWSETAKLADIVLPATSMLEQDDFVASWWHQYFGYSRKVMEPMGESKPNWWVTNELAERMGLEWLKEDPMDAIRRALSKSRMIKNFEEILNKPYVKLEYPPKDLYQTPSGKIEFYSKIAEELGYSPLPVVAWEEVDDDYPFRLITSAVPGNTSSQDLMDLSQDFIHMNALDCEKMEINDEDRVILESKYGRVTGVVKIDNSLPEGVIWTRRSAIMLDGFINDLITDEKQRINGGNCLNSTRVRVSKVR